MVIEHFKKLAYRYLRLADATANDAEAARLKLLAADYLERGQNAGSGTTQQQQQIQPKDDKTDES
jgi:hypothetical protein